MKNIVNDFVAKPGTYIMTFHCDNCGESFTEVFNKGERAVQGECTNCGCSPEKRLRDEYMDKMF